ncbi:unnamed protein product [Protopolystoma xenopodis]|uniref:Uncharacterized protein n=1 Tax=Protopolystoma xenopodis TaxID=117903 RepID=A0A448WDC2_9PLAT|nr:unnamed protein product [Protopolystoma xenopodis]
MLKCMPERRRRTKEDAIGFMSALWVRDTRFVDRSKPRVMRPGWLWLPVLMASVTTDAMNAKQELLAELGN